ncbi:DUF29 domain-containing protein [Stenomitos frigidus]|uniref:DUF29 domain-containing protein n=1 Tax=Stenomitos frigidus ULC18 TaxID=2107698 RepID=A0A2T1E5X8_9CYAN|nr:DUF29 domain-containing protein [Stenomitos frigidus]PSB28138.1 DUF29 domain-containing protein [Stenomitos frigidus ULC18]
MTAKHPETSAPTAQLYDRDYYLWLQETAQLLRNGEFARLDVENLVEEIESMGRSDKQAIESNLEVVLMHLLKYKYQPERRSNSWRFTLLEHRNRLTKAFRDSPSLRSYFGQTFDESYQQARKLAAAETGLPNETFPSESPFTPEQSLDADYLPE